MASAAPRRDGGASFASRSLAGDAARGVPAWLRRDERREPGHSFVHDFPHDLFRCGHRPVVVGVVNVTPDSFSDGGRHFTPRDACARVDRVIEEGADVVEVGAESTRPAGATYGAGYEPVSTDEQLARALPAVRHAAGRGARVAIDTTRAEVAEAALAAGATIVNDVSLLSDPSLASVCAVRGAWLVLMHSRPGAASHYQDVIGEIAREWSVAAERANAEGVARDKLVMDPGIGFGKGAVDNFAVLAGLERLHVLGHPLYVGASRKSFIAHAEARDGLPESAPDERVGGSVAASLFAARMGAAVLRVHDVRALRQAIAVEAQLALARVRWESAQREAGGD